MAGIVSGLESYLKRVNNELLNSSHLAQHTDFPTTHLLASEKSKSFIEIKISNRVAEIFGNFLDLYGDFVRSFLGGQSLLHIKSPLFLVRYSGNSFHILFGATIHQEDLMALLVIATLCLVLLAVWKLAVILLWDSCEEIIHLYSELSQQELSVSEDSSIYESFEESAYIPLLIGICKPASNFPTLGLKEQGSLSLYEDFEAKDSKYTYGSPLSSDATIVAVGSSPNNLLKSRPIQSQKGGHQFIVSAEYLLLLVPTVDSWLEQLPICSSGSDILESLVEISKIINGDSTSIFLSDQIILLRFFVSTDYMGPNDQIRSQVSLVASQISDDPGVIISTLENRELRSDCKVELMLLVSALAVFDVYDCFLTSLMEAILMALLRVSKHKGVISTFAQDSFCVIIASSSDGLLMDLFNLISDTPDESGTNLIMLIRSLAFYIVVNEKNIVQLFLMEPTSNKIHSTVIQLILKSHSLYRKHPDHLQECQHLGTAFTLLDEMTTLYNVILGIFSENTEIPSPIQLELIDSVVSKIYDTLKEEPSAAEIQAPSIKGLGAK